MKLKDVKSFADFKYWLKNVYWYHYKVHTALVIIGVVALTATIVSTVTRPETDFTILISTMYGYDTTAVELFQADLEGVIEDRDGDGEVVLKFHFLNTDEASQTGMTNRMLQIALMSNDDVLLILMDKETMDVYDENDMFLTLDSLGYPGQTTLEVQSCDKLADLYLGERSHLTAGIIDRPAAQEDIDMAYKLLAYLLS